MMGEQIDLFYAYSSEQILCKQVSDPAAYICPQRTNHKTAGIISGPNDKPHQNSQPSKPHFTEDSHLPHAAPGTQTCPA